MCRAVSVIAVVSVCLIAGNAYGVIDGCRSEWGVSCSGMRVTTCPQGDFEFIRDGCGTGGGYIWVQVVDSGGLGVPGIPWSDYWLQAYDPAEELCLCVDAILADSLTNFMGRTTISGRFAAGGCALTGGLRLAVLGNIILDWPACIDIHVEHIVIVSVDLNADCQVDLSDLAVFGSSFNRSLGDPDFNTCCDYNDDDECDLSDFAFMGQHYQHECF